MLSCSFFARFFLQQAADSTAEKDRQKPSMATYFWPFLFCKGFSSLEFYRSVYSSSTLFFLDCIYSRLSAIAEK